MKENSLQYNNMPDNINWKLIESKTNETVEELNEQEIYQLQQWEEAKHQQSSYMWEFPYANITPYL